MITQKQEIRNIERNKRFAILYTFVIITIFSLIIGLITREEPRTLIISMIGSLFVLFGITGIIIMSLIILNDDI